MRTDHLLAVVSLFCLAGGMSVSYVKARAEGLGLNADVGLVERPERVLIGLTSIGLSGLGIPYVLPIGMWALAAGTAITLCQRMRAVHLDAKSKGRPSAGRSRGAAHGGANTAAQHGRRAPRGRLMAKETFSGAPAQRGVQRRLGPGVPPSRASGARPLQLRRRHRLAPPGRRGAGP